MNDKFKILLVIYMMINKYFIDMLNDVYHRSLFYFYHG